MLFKTRWGHRCCGFLCFKKMGAPKQHQTLWHDKGFLAELVCLRQCVFISRSHALSAKQIQYPKPTREKRVCSLYARPKGTLLHLHRAETKRIRLIRKPIALRHSLNLHELLPLFSQASHNTNVETAPSMKLVFPEQKDLGHLN